MAEDIREPASEMQPPLKDQIDAAWRKVDKNHAVAVAKVTGNCVACGAVVDITDAPLTPKTCDDCGEKAVFKTDAEPKPETSSFAKIISEALVETLRTGLAHNTITDKIHVTFGNGSQLLVAFEGNYFTLSQSDRAFLQNITNLMQLYNEDVPEGCEVVWAADHTVSFPSGKRPTRWERFKSVFGG